MGWGAIAALGGNAVTSLIAANSAKKAAEISANASAENTQKQIDWYREMANNAHQMEVEDLRKAGLNPILSAGGSTAGAIASNGISPQMPDTSGYAQSGAVLAQGIQSGLQFMNDTKRVQNETKLAQAEVAQKTIQTVGQQLENENLPKKQKAELINMMAQARKTLAETQNTQLDSAQKSFQNKVWNAGNTGLDIIKNAIEGFANEPTTNKPRKKSNTGKNNLKYFKIENGKKTYL